MEGFEDMFPYGYNYVEEEAIWEDLKDCLNNPRIKFSKIVEFRIKRRWYKPEFAAIIAKTCERFIYFGIEKNHCIKMKVRKDIVKQTICDSNGNPFIDYYYSYNAEWACYKKEILAHRKRLIKKGIYDAEIHRVDDLIFAK